MLLSPDLNLAAAFAGPKCILTCVKTLDTGKAVRPLKVKVDTEPFRPPPLDIRSCQNARGAIFNAKCISREFELVLNVKIFKNSYALKGSKNEFLSSIVVREMHGRGIWSRLRASDRSNFQCFDENKNEKSAMMQISS